MKKLLLLALFVLFAGNASAEVLCEGFDDPLIGWRDRWLAQNSNMMNVYTCPNGGDENNRGNNPCGLWICDTDDDRSTSNIIFDSTFGATVSHFELEIVSFVGGLIRFYDLGDALVYETTVVSNGTFPPCPGLVYGTDFANGLGRFWIGPSSVEGNTSIDNVCATVDEGPNPTEETTWGQLKNMYK